jgi:hypothetical protein
VFRGLHVPTGEQVVFKVIRAVPQSLPKKALHVSLRGCETFEDILREVRITRYDYGICFSFLFSSFCCFHSSPVSFFLFKLLPTVFLFTSSLFLHSYRQMITAGELPQVHDTSVIIISLPGSN